MNEENAERQFLRRLGLFLKFGADGMRRLYAADGYTNLGMWRESLHELESIDTEDQDRPEFLMLRVDALKGLKRWELVQRDCRRLAELQPGRPEHVIKLAEATRAANGEEAAASILQEARSRFPKNGVIAYNLACYLAVLGQVGEIGDLLKTAFALDERLQEYARNDSDLAGVISG